jgi:hypothetical protein
LGLEFFAAASIAAFSSWFQTAPALRKAEMSAVLQPSSARIMRRQHGMLTARSDSVVYGMC